jgi:AbiJ N-terminal domain 4
MQPFSIRHGKALVEQRIRVTMKDRLRHRLWLTVQKYNEIYWYQPDPSDNWSSKTSIAEQIEIKLKRLLGFPELKSRAAEDAVGLEGYFMKGYPSCALEVIEQFAEELSTFGEHGYGKRQTKHFQTEINEAMMDFECPWRLSDGRFFQIDAEFFQAEIIQKGEDILREKGFEGAHDEFREARADFVDGKTKDVILKAFKSFESTLKTVLNQHSGDITDLIRMFRERGFLDDIPEGPAKAVSKTVLGSLATLRNELAGHGQGNAVLEVPRHYAVLAIHLAGSLNQFVLDQYLRKQSHPTAMSPCK